MRPLLLVALSGCYVGPMFRLQEDAQSCASPRVELQGDLPMKVDQGPGDGTFGYTYLGWPLVQGTSGAYDLKTGAFTWTNTYAPDSVRVKEDVTGTGLILRNGDLDLGYAQVVTFLDGTQVSYDVRHERVGCNEVLRVAPTEDPEEVVLTEGTWVGGGFEWTRHFVEGPAAVEGLGRMEADRSWVEYVEFHDGGLDVSWATDDDGNGHQTRTFNDDDGFSKTEGSWERWFDGTVSMSFTRNNPNIQKQTWDFSVDALGNGEGSWSDPDDACDISFTEWKCRLKACTNEAFQGACEVPVTWPVF